MKKRFFVCVAIATLALFLVAGPAMASDNYLSGKAGVGYQGMVSDGYFNGISVRGWAKRQLRLGRFHFSMVELLSTSRTAGTLAECRFDNLRSQGHVRVRIVKSNSRFYIGAKVGYGMIDVDMMVKRRCLTTICGHSAPSYRSGVELVGNPRVRIQLRYRLQLHKV